MTAISMPASQNRPKLPAKPMWFGGSMPAARLGLIINLIIPGALLIWDAFHQNLGVNAVNFAIKTTGLIAVTYLVLSLVVTPLQAVTHQSWLVQFRRAIGCYAAYFAAAHLGIYFWWDQSRNLSSTAYEITHRFYLMIGFMSLLLMVPLLLTSFNGAIRWMGGRKWKLLHRLAYLSAALACYHYYLQSKADKSKPEVYIAVLGLLLAYRLVAGVIRIARKPKRTVASAATTAGTSKKSRFWKGELKVVGMSQETPSVRTFRFAMPDGSPIPFDFKAGQFLSLTVPIDGKKVVRSYTIASSPTRDAYLELTIKREDQGHVSRYLHDMLMNGHNVSISAPAGKFTFEPNGESAPASGVTLIAGGVGITPSMSIIRDLTDRGWAGDIDLFFIVRTPADVIFADELKDLAARHPNLHLHRSITRDGPKEWRELRGRLTRDLLKQRVANIATQPAYICGPDAMAVSARAELIAAGVPAKRITVESFTPAAAVSRDAGAMPLDELAVAATTTVTFARSVQTAVLNANVTVLEAAESVGVPMDFQCRAGICGTCRCRLLSGEVAMDVRDALTEEEESDGYILACQAKPLGDVTIDA